MKLHRRSFLRLATSAAALPVVSRVTRAQDWPSRPIRMVVPFAAGGPTDIVARVMGAKMGELLGQQFVIENRAGAGGNFGADVVAKSPADGYTLLMATVSTHAINPGLYKKMSYDPIRDFTPVGEVGVTPTILGVNPAIPATDVNSLIALLKANPGKYTYGSSGIGSILHLCGEQFKTLAGGLNVVHVPYRCSAPMMNDLIGGQISFAFDATPTCWAATLTASTTAAAPPGNYTITITGTSGSLVHTTSVGLTINADRLLIRCVAAVNRTGRPSPR